MSKIIAVSRYRYRATAAERRLYGGNTVTEFFVFRTEDKKDPSKWIIIRGYGRTPGDRKTDAIKRSGLLVEKDHQRNRDVSSSEVQRLLKAYHSNRFQTSSKLYLKLKKKYSSRSN